MNQGSYASKSTRRPEKLLGNDLLHLSNSGCSFKNLVSWKEAPEPRTQQNGRSGSDLCVRSNSLKKPTVFIFCAVMLVSDQIKAKIYLSVA